MAGLANGTRFPSMELQRVGGNRLSLPDELDGAYGVVLAFRGSWCTRCNAQLSLFQQALPQFASEDIGIVAFSTDDESHANEMVTSNGIEFPVGYGVDVEDISQLLKGYTNDAHRSLESSNFLLRPDGTIELSVYSSGPIGRLVPEDVIDIVRRRRRQ
ncbi:MAG TPA: redoxin domain-containing protein [Acidimicrobiales bacterium]|nr:redoxin domain-containing protein [Acidimicrobiales bacterium]